MWVAASVALLSLQGCFPCEGVAVAFPDDPLVVGGTWEGVATSGQHPEIALLLVLDVHDVTPRSYAVTGQLELDDTTLLQVEGGVSGFCEQRFMPSGVVIPATPAPELPRFEATLYGESGALAGHLLTYRVHTPRQATETMEGQLWLQGAGTARSYGFVVTRR